MGLFDFLGGGGGGGDQVVTSREPTFKQLPDYPEAEGARVNWWETLQKWQNEPGYGAIAPNWNDIWENARQKVQRYFYGGPEGPGAIANVKAGLARRGASEDPASATAISRLNMQQGNQLQDMAVKQAMEEANLGEKGRTSWLSSLQSLAGLKPAFVTGSNTVTTKTSAPDYSNLGEFAGGGITDLLNSGGSGNGFDSIMSMFGGSEGGSAGNSDTGIGDMGGLFGFFDGEDSFGDNTGDVLKDPETYKQIAQIAAMFCWVAAEVFPLGWDDPKTHQARHFIGNIGPKWFKNLYIKHGEKFAAFIKDKPVIKNVIRPIFETFAFIGKLDLEQGGLVYGLR